jgi:cobalt/nickel transport system permease protein
MHIPDGYLSPATCVVMYGAAVPFWYRASQRAKQVMSSRMVPLISIFAALSFVIQMFNIPVPGGTTAHAVGGVLAAIVLGPWPAVLGVSVVLAIQAIFFGDGGITAIGANSFNMAVALPLVGYAIYRLTCGSSPSPGRRTIAAAIGGYVGINVAALLTAIELGIQPIFWSEGGRALYNPYGLETTVPAMLVTHLTIAGFAEAAITALVIAYLLRTFPTLVDEKAGVVSRELGKVGWTMAGLLIALAVLAPMGLLAPGGAEFEWSADEVAQHVGYVPAGLSHLSDLWRLAPLPDYAVPWLGSEASFFDQALWYILSAIVGIGLVLVFIFGIRVLLARGPRNHKADYST